MINVFDKGCGDCGGCPKPKRGGCGCPEEECEGFISLQLFATKKGGGSSKNGRDSNAQRLGVKVGDGSTVSAGSIIIRQRGTQVLPGTGVGIGRDHTIFATVPGRVTFSTTKDNRKKVSVIA